MKIPDWRIWHHHDTERQDLFRPGRDWRILLGLMLLGLAITFVTYFWLKQGLDELSHSEAAANASSTTAHFTREDLTKYASDLETRQTKFDLLRNSPETFADPSL